MIIIKNLEQLEEIKRKEELSKNLYEYIRNKILKFNNVLPKGKFKIVVNIQNNQYSKYKLKWQRISLIGEVKYKESFIINNDEGILIINPVKSTK